MELLVKIILTALLWGAIMGGFALAGSTILWWLALLIAAVIVFGGFLFFSGDGTGEGWS